MTTQLFIVLQAIANVEGLVVIDVVEGTALASLPHMATVLKQRPASFTSLQAAVHWARKSGRACPVLCKPFLRCLPLAATLCPKLVIKH